MTSKMLNIQQNVNESNIQGSFTMADSNSITKTCLFKYTENFTNKERKFSDNFFFIFFHISAQN